MSAMTQQEWAARVAEIGALAGWGAWWRVKENIDLPPSLDSLAWMATVGAKGGTAVILAIRQLCADWLASEGVTANRVCRWKHRQYYAGGLWEGDCGAQMEIVFGTPATREMHYCYKCGGTIQEVPA